MQIITKQITKKDLMDMLKNKYEGYSDYDTIGMNVVFIKDNKVVMDKTVYIDEEGE